MTDQDGRTQFADTIVRADSEASAVEAAREWRTAWDAERGNVCEGFFDDEYVRAVPYTASDGVDDGTSWLAVAVALGGLGSVLLVSSAVRVPVLSAVASAGWDALGWVSVAGVVLTVVIGVMAGAVALAAWLRSRREPV